MPERPVDHAEREAALDTARSIIVQAPAGSGKTDLLTRRYMKLLAEVDEPEEILAITFTRPAAAEMRTRILGDLEAAARGASSDGEDSERIQLAREALAQAERRRWNLLVQPQRLAVETIDSLSLRIAADRPLLAGLGGRLQPTEQAQHLYALAAQRTFQQLGGSDAGLTGALAHLLDLRDNRLEDCESLIANMLATRDQWVDYLVVPRSMTEDDWAYAREKLEAPFRRESERVRAAAHRFITEQPAIAERIIELANYACAKGNPKIALLDGIPRISESMLAEHWLCLSTFLLTEKGEWRKSVNKNDGFPANTKEEKQRKDDMLGLLRLLQPRTDILAALCDLRSLPAERYSDAQWQTLRHLLTVLRRAIAELRLAFAELNQVDFTEITLAAIEVLKSAPDRAPGIAALARHLLIDEFQDTSRRQLDLVNHLIRAWDLSEHRTVFLVGDPMQSIYMFRQAEVDIFSDVRSHGIGPGDNRIHCHPVKLSVNFRSHSGLTTPINDFFHAIAADDPPPGSSQVRFVPAAASKPTPRSCAVHVHAQIIGSLAAPATPEENVEARRKGAQTVFEILERHRREILDACAEHREYRVAVLVRARPHLAHLVELLRNDPDIHFRAVEIETLAERQELLDLRSLTRALLHPMDRVAWLAVLRAPWCGLTLADLHRLTGSDAREARDLSILELIERNQHLLSQEGQQRLARTAAILHRALDLRWRQSESPSFASWIERTWRTLGGPASLDAAAQENAQVFFSLLEAVAPDGLAPLTPGFDATLDRLFAQPDPSASERCGIQLMTIHKAKGLGFDVVIVPGLDRQPSKDDQPLIASLERRNPFDPSIDEFLVAPISLKGDDADSIYKWVTTQRKLRFDEERKRLFYVACTRARQELHLLGTARLSSKGLGHGAPDSLLAAAWPALRRNFEARAEEQAAADQAAVSANLLPFPGPMREPAVLPALAASAGSLYPRRLRLGYEPPLPAPGVLQASADLLISSDPPEFLRPQGSREARVIGSAVHTLLQRLGSRLAHLAPDRLRVHAESLLRAAALTGQGLTSATDAVTRLLSACAADPICQWILAAHPEEQSEAAWSGFTASRLRTLRADRVFRAGPAPLVSGLDFLWIIDYKTGSIPASAFSNGRAAFLAAERALYAPQLEAYGRALRAVHGSVAPLRLALYYPALPALDFWNPDDPT